MATVIPFYSKTAFVGPPRPSLRQQLRAMGIEPAGDEQRRRRREARALARAQSSSVRSALGGLTDHARKHPVPEASCVGSLEAVVERSPPTP